MITQKDYDVVYGALTLACLELKKSATENNEVNDYINKGSIEGYFLMKAFEMLKVKLQPN